MQNRRLHRQWSLVVLFACAAVLGYIWFQLGLKLFALPSRPTPLELSIPEMVADTASVLDKQTLLHWSSAGEPLVSSDPLPSLWTVVAFLDDSTDAGVAAQDLLAVCESFSGASSLITMSSTDSSALLGTVGCFRQQSDIIVPTASAARHAGWMAQLASTMASMDSPDASHGVYILTAVQAAKSTAFINSLSAWRQDAILGIEGVIFDKLDSSSDHVVEININANDARSIQRAIRVDVLRSQFAMSASALVSKLQSNPTNLSNDLTHEEALWRALRQWSAPLLSAYVWPTSAVIERTASSSSHQDSTLMPSLALQMWSQSLHLESDLGVHVVSSAAKDSLKLIDGLLERGHAVIQLLPDADRHQHRVEIRDRLMTINAPCPLMIALWMRAQIIWTDSNELPPTQNITIIPVAAHHWSFVRWFGSLDITALQNWHRPEYELHVLTFRRPISLSRLLASLQSAVYLSDRPHLVVHVDAQPDHETVMITQNISWPFRHTLHRRHFQAGILTAMSEAWSPLSNDQYAVFLEDDVEVSPLFFIWAKLAILHTRYGQQDTDWRSRVFGVSLYTPRVQELSLPRVRISPEDDFAPPLYPRYTPYLAQVPCSWGAVYFPDHWRAYHAHLDIRLNDTTIANNVIIPNSRSNAWAHSWKKYYIEYAVLKAAVMVYPNFARQQSFSTNHLELGVHVGKRTRTKSKIEMFTVPLLPLEAELGDALFDGRFPSLHELPLVDLFHRQVMVEMLVQTADMVECRWRSTCDDREQH